METTNFIGKKYKYNLFIICSIILFVPFLLYLSINHNNSFSKSPVDWANFSTYISLFVGLANLVVFILLTQRINTINEELNMKNNLLQISLNRPVISFRRNNSNSKYEIENIGNGVALNTKLKIRTSQSGNFEIEYIMHSLKKDFNREIEKTPINCLIANYEDIFGNKYISFMIGDKLSIINENEIDNFPALKEFNAIKCSGDVSFMGK